MDDGLDIRQAFSRVKVEYEKSIKSNKLEKLIIYMVLCEEGIKNNFLREDIKQQTLDLLAELETTEFSKELSENEKSLLISDVNRVSALLA